MRSVLLLLCLLALPVGAAEPSKPSRPVVLKAARLFDAKAGKLVTPGLVVVVDGKISGVGPRATVPAGAEVIDLGDATLLPGFMDAHTHRAATTVNAELLGLADRLGALEAGLLADVIAVPGDPVQDIRRTEQVFFVMKEGVVYRDDRAPVAPSGAR